MTHDRRKSTFSRASWKRLRVTRNDVDLTRPDTVKGETRPHEVVPELERILSAGKNVVSTAMRVLNAIPAVCQHAPGLVSTLDLPYTPTRNLRR